jgi:glycosyltransferase involved in cell wall biosynthesis
MHDRTDGHNVVDVAIIAESTYPYLKGGVSAVIQDIVEGNPDLTYGIIHITWDRDSPTTDLYGVPDNVLWIKTIYLSMSEHRDDFMSLTPASLRMRRSARTRLANRLFDALQAITEGDPEPMWSLYDEGMNPRTQQFPVWALLGTEEFMQVLVRRLPALELPLTDSFWQMREFFSLAYALLNEDFPFARVYHAHTTGYASLVGAAAARQNGTSFFLTEHNLYVRDTINTLLGRSMALPVTASDWRTFDVTPTQRAWMAWWIEMGRFCYPSAAHITYLYPEAITEAAALGAPSKNVSIVPNGMTVSSFDGVYHQRLKATEAIHTEGSDRTWRLVYIARVVPIKGLLEFIDSARILVERGITNWHLDVLGPTDHVPSYYEACRAKLEQLGLERYLTFRGTVEVRAMLGDFDLLVLPSFNEGQPIVVLEAMTAGLPTVGTAVGGMRQLVADPLITASGTMLDSCGVLVDPADLVTGMADALQEVLVDPRVYERLTRNARDRVEQFFQLHEAMHQYNRLYRLLGGLPPLLEHAAADRRRERESIPGTLPTVTAHTMLLPAVRFAPTRLPVRRTQHPPMPYYPTPAGRPGPPPPRHPTPVPARWQPPVPRSTQRPPRSGPTPQRPPGPPPHPTGPVVPPNRRPPNHSPMRQRDTLPHRPATHGHGHPPAPSPGRPGAAAAPRDPQSPPGAYEGRIASPPRQDERTGGRRRW